MHKKKVSIVFRIAHWFSSHPFLKLIALIMAIMIWYYAKGEISRLNY